MFPMISTWLLVTAFAGAGTFNMIGTRATRADFRRWGYPAWWCRVTGGLEIAVAFLIAFPATHRAGLVLGVAIVVAAIATVCRHREPSHLVPLAVFAVLLASAAATLP